MKAKTFTSCDSVSHEGVTNTWFTPRSIIEPLGKFDLDPCTQTFRPFDTAWRCICEDGGGNGLIEPWFGRVWLNPPYGKHISLWLDKMAVHGNGIALVFARTETAWAQKAFTEADAFMLLEGRIAFIRQDGKCGTNAGTGSMLLAYGQNNVQMLTDSGLDGLIFKRRMII